MKPKLKSPYAYYGSKIGMLPRILPNIPEHKIYTEAFFGSGAVFFAKEPSWSEIINDRNEEVMNFFRVLKSQPRKLRQMIEQTPFSRSAFNKAALIYQNPWLYDDLSPDFAALKRAHAFYISACQAFSGIVDGRSWAVARDNSVPKAFKNRKLRFNEDLIQRLELVQLECNDAVKVITSRDRADAFHYVDPPYFNSDCGHYEDYSEQDYTRLLETLAKVKGKFLLSSYPSAVLDKFVNKYRWHQNRYNMKVSVTFQSKKIKTEVLTSNYPLIYVPD